MRRGRAAEGSKSETATVGRRHWQLPPSEDEGGKAEADGGSDTGELAARSEAGVGARGRPSRARG
jgi:hypothetical protein